MTSPERILRSCIITAWIEGLPCTQHHLAVAATARGAKMSQRQVGIWFEKWGKAGTAETQIASNGRPGAAYVFNWTGAPVDSITLRDLVEPVLLEDSGEQRQDEDSKKLRSALRLTLGVDERGNDVALLAACASVVAREFHALPERVHDAAIGQVSKRTAKNYRTRIRRLLRDAAESGSAPIIFERNWDEDAWSLARDRYFGSAVGTMTQEQRSLRCYREAFANGAKSLRPQPAGLDEVTVGMVDSICDHCWELGKPDLGAHIRSMLRRIARKFCEGPYAAAVKEEGVRWTRNGWRNPGRLMGPRGEAASDGDWNSFLEMVEHAGYGADWIDFLRWYGEYITLDFDEVEKQPERFPTRPPRWQLKPTSRVKRIINLRTILYHAPRVLGKQPRELTLHEVFGTMHRVMIAELKTWWAARSGSEKLISSANSDGLEKLIIAYGLAAYAQCLKSQHKRSSAPDTPEDHRGNTQAGGNATRQEQVLLAAYRASRSHAKKIEKSRKRESNAHGGNTVRDLPRLIRNTPASFWIALLDEMFRQVQSHILQVEDQVLQIREGITPLPLPLAGRGRVLPWLAHLHGHANQRDRPCEARHPVQRRTKSSASPRVSPPRE